MATVEQSVGGVSFALTDEQKELRALAREFATKEIRPRAAEYDVAMRHPADVIDQAHALGLMTHRDVVLGGLRPDLLRRELAREGAQLLLLVRQCERRRRRQTAPRLP